MAPTSHTIAEPPDAVITELSANSGSFSVGRDDYGNELKRCWRIVPKLGADDLVQLRFSKIDVEKGYDKLSVRRLEEDKAVRAQRDTLYLSRKGFMVCLITDESVTADGFEARYESWSAAAEEAAAT